MDLHGIKLGEGATYVVEKRRVKMSLSVHCVAVKRLKFEVPNALNNYIPDSGFVKKALRAILLEVGVAVHLSPNRNVVQCLGYVWPARSMSPVPLLVMELAPHGSLKDVFSHENLSTFELLAICDDIIAGLRTLHSAFIVHGDIKQENFLAFPSTEPGRKFDVKITDFGNALMVNCRPSYGGTPIYSAPEIQLHRHVGEIDHSLTQTDIKKLMLSDVFSFGLLAFEVFCHGKRYYDCLATKPFRDALINKSLSNKNILDNDKQSH
jgi:serine/threonine protein kinase